MKISKGLFSVIGIGIGALSVPGWSAGTDIMRSPNDWRGTLLEGTDAVIATNSYGEPLFVQSGETVGPMFAPAAIDGNRLATEFKQLCIDTTFDEGKLAKAAETSRFALANKKFAMLAQKGNASYQVSVWQAPEARVQIWAGDLNALSNRQRLCQGKCT